MKTKFLSLLLIGIFFINSVTVSAQAVNVQDSSALVDLFNSTNGNGWINHTNWLTTSPVSSWYGITVENGRVTRVTLNRNGLVGTIPSSIGNMTALIFLVLGENQLSGTIPISVGNLPNLIYFDVNNNLLSNPLPLSLTNLKAGAYINLQYNRFTFQGIEQLLLTPGLMTTGFPQADIPLIRNGNVLSVSAGGTLSRTSYQWYKDGAQLISKTGDSTLTITSEGNYYVVVTHNLSPNLILYSIAPTNVQDSLALVELYNSTNGSGWVNKTNWLTTAPACTWQGVTVRNGRVKYLQLHFNQLTGTLPATIGNLTGLEKLDLQSNQLTGNIPTSITDLSNLTELQLNFNQLTGSIPYDIGKLSALTGLYLAKNQLTGSIPSSVVNISPLRDLYLDRNQLTGTIPNSIGNLVNLYSFFVSNNQLTGLLPASLGRDTQLRMLGFSDNQFTGGIPDSFAFLTLLQRLQVHNNELTGPLPVFLTNLTQLFDLQVQNNQFSGTVPTMLTQTFGTFNISSNKFTFAGMETLPVQNPNASKYLYAPQANIPFRKHNDTLSVSAGGTPANDTFRLYRNGTLTTTQVGDSIFKITTTGTYSIKVTNSIATALALYSDTLILTALLADSGTTIMQFITGTSPTDINDGIYKVVTVTPTPGVNSLNGNVTATVAIDTGVRVYHNQPYVPRHYDITPSVNASTSQATVTLYFTQQDFDRFNSYVIINNLGLPLMPTGGINNGNIRIMQFHGSFTATPDPGNFADTTIVILIPAVTWDNINNWWTVTFQVTGFSGFFLTTGSGALPVNLVEFKGKLNNNSVLLQWISENEKSTKEYIIERGVTSTVFKEIGKMTARSMQPRNNYYFTDANPLDGNNFYRLKIIEVDGRISYSNIFTIRFTDGHRPSIYPNPVKTVCTVSFDARITGTYQINISDQSGKIIKRITGTTVQGTNKIAINMEGYAAGTYIVTVTEGLESITLPMNKR